MKKLSKKASFIFSKKKKAAHAPSPLSADHRSDSPTPSSEGMFRLSIEGDARLYSRGSDCGSVDSDSTVASGFHMTNRMVGPTDGLLHQWKPKRKEWKQRQVRITNTQHGRGMLEVLKPGKKKETCKHRMVLDTSSFVGPCPRTHFTREHSFAVNCGAQQMLFAATSVSEKEGWIRSIDMYRKTSSKAVPGGAGGGAAEGVARSAPKSFLGSPRSGGGKSMRMPKSSRLRRAASSMGIGRRAVSEAVSSTRSAERSAAIKELMGPRPHGGHGGAYASADSADDSGDVAEYNPNDLLETPTPYSFGARTRRRHSSADNATGGGGVLGAAAAGGVGRDSVGSVGAAGGGIGCMYGSSSDVLEAAREEDALASAGAGGAAAAARTERTMRRNTPHALEGYMGGSGRSFVSTGASSSLGSTGGADVDVEGYVPWSFSNKSRLVLPITKKDVENTREGFTRLLGNERQCAAFRAFCEKEHSPESLMFWREVETFRAKGQSRRRGGTAQKKETGSFHGSSKSVLPKEAASIFTKYIRSDATLMVNVGSATLKLLTATVEGDPDGGGAGKGGGVGVGIGVGVGVGCVCTRDMFDAAQNEVFNLMFRDNFRRFHGDLDAVDALEGAARDAAAESRSRREGKG